MPLVIYTDINEVHSDKKYVMDCEPYFMKTGISGTNFNKFVLKEIENGSYYSKNYFIDRFGVKLPLESLSTTSKLAMLVNEYSDVIWDLSEAGINIGYVLTRISEGYVLIPKSSIRVYDWGYKDIKVSIDTCGIHFNQLSDFCHYISEVLE